MKKKIIIAIVVLVAAIVTTLIIKGRSDFRYAGVVDVTRIDISARVSSVVSAREATEGTRIAEGQIVYRLSGEDIRILADTAEKDFSRAERLYKMGSMPLETYEHLKQKRDDAVLKLKWCDIEAPISGTLINTYREKGEWVGPGTRLFSMADLKDVWSMIYVEQPMIARLKLGQKVKAMLPEMRERRFEGTIAKINSEAEFTPKNVQTREERTRLVYGVKIAFSNPDELLKPGMTIEVEL